MDVDRLKSGGSILMNEFFEHGNSKKSGKSGFLSASSTRR